MANQSKTKNNPAKTQTDTATPPGKNRLAFEKSPYLLQHAENPVDWYPWSDEAFEKAKRENKPVFLSIGYSTCHWCHVMEHESFEDPDVAKLMNAIFVCIKVDREERPDIDSVYMNVCQMMTGSGGWPMTILMTPDKKPFYAGTYFPKTTRMGRIGMMELCGKVSELWRTKKSALLTSADKITADLSKYSKTIAGDRLTQKDLEQTFLELQALFDPRYGGFGNAPKFPTPHNLTFLLRYWKRTGDKKALEMVETTLQKMRRGGIYDHVGFGFHRYSTDYRWLTPHFEKMLYDQALITIACVDAYQATGKQEYASTAHEIITYVFRDMTSPAGGFYSAEDADSDGVEGKFYVWSKDELEKTISKEDAELVIAMFGVTPEGNFNDEATGHKTGNNILHLANPIEETAKSLKVTEKELTEQWEKIRQKLYDIREKRIHPYKDDKILTDWNGLMITALAKAARAFDRSDYAAAAQKCVDFIREKLTTPDGRLLHRYRQGHAGITAPLDDYAFMIWALTELYETNFNTDNLEFALKLNEHLQEYFWDDKNGGYYFTPDDGEKLLVRNKDIYDGAVPSGNSIAMLALLRLARITGDTDLEEKANKIAMAFAGQISQRPSSYTQLMSAADFAVGPAYEVVIAGEPEAPETKTMLQALRTQYIPNKVVLLRPADTGKTAQKITKIAPYTALQLSLKNKATAYVCQNFQCNLPTSRPDEMLKLLRKDKSQKSQTPEK